MDILLENIRHRRKELGISLSDMSSYLGYKYPSGYLSIEKGRKQLTLIQAVKILKKLNMQFTNVDIHTFTLKKLRKHRIQKGLSLKTMSLLLDYKYPSGYANLEYGKRKITYENAVKISKILGVPLEELFFDS